jgi:low temperature requirement protein LtrA
MNDGEADHWLRPEEADEEQKAGFPELFFDLVFVFAMIQLSHTLAGHFSVNGLLEAALVALALWWVWIHTAWVTNWLDTNRMPVRIMLFAMMFAALLMASAIPQAFEHKGLLFAVAYVTMQVGRSLFAVYAFRNVLPNVRDTFKRIACWFALSGIFWIAGGLAEHEARLTFWAIALVLEYIAPELAFFVPGLGRASPKDWNVSGAHMAERCGLFVMICLGETILSTGRNFSELPFTTLPVVIFSGAFASTVAMWWIYFHFGHERASHEIETSAKPGEVALHVFTYAHLPVMAGIVMSAVAEEFMLSEPLEQGNLQHALAIIGGPFIFLGGNFWVKSATTRSIPWSHVGGLVALLGLLLFVPYVQTYVLGTAALIVLLSVAAIEYLLIERGSLDGEDIGEQTGE